MNLLETDGNPCRIEEIRGPAGFRSHLESLGFVKGTEVFPIRRIFPGIIVRARGSTVAFSPEAASLVVVRKGL